MTVRVVVDLTEEQAARLSDWQEVAAARIQRRDDGTATLELSSDLERITAPEADDA